VPGRPNIQEIFRENENGRNPRNLGLVALSSEQIPYVSPEEIILFNTLLRNSKLPESKKRWLKLMDPLPLPAPSEDDILSGAANNYSANFAHFVGSNERSRFRTPASLDDLQELRYQKGKIKIQRLGSHLLKPAFWRAAEEKPDLVLPLAANIGEHRASRGNSQDGREEVMHTDELVEAGNLMARRVDRRDPGVINPDGSINLLYFIT
jgi:hypothetical protein